MDNRRYSNFNQLYVAEFQLPFGKDISIFADTD